MLGEILEINNNHIIIKNNNTEIRLNSFVKITDTDEIYIGEIILIKENNITIKLMGVLRNNSFIYGVTRKPSFKATISLLNNEEIQILFGINSYTPNNGLYVGKSALYQDYPIYLNINNFFSNHSIILGNSGSGKSCGVARLLQNLFYKQDASPVNSTFFIIDAYGEYQNAFKQIDYVNKSLKFKYYDSDTTSTHFLRIPLWLLSVDDICLLLEVNNKNQIPIVEKALKLVKVFIKNDDETIKFKNSIIAKALLDIFINGKTPASIRDQIFSVLSRYNTKDLNLDSEVYLPGYVRPLKQCLMIDNTGKIKDMELVINFLQQYVIEDFELAFPDASITYSLKDLLYAFDFALIDEGILNNDRVFELANSLRVRLASIVNSDYCRFFEFEQNFNNEDFFNELTTTEGYKAQVININLANIDDRFAKVIAKIYSKFLFDYGKYEVERGTKPINIILEEAHRYVQHDNDIEILGYNIFERIAKEGRKYAVLLTLISQRPSELSQTVLSQCSNFLIFKISHPEDINYIKPMIPFIEDDTVEKIKNLQVGHTLLFGNSFNFPTIIKMDMASPAPISSNCDVANTWF